jgi:hypothetical protein
MTRNVLVVQNWKCITGNKIQGSVMSGGLDMQSDSYKWRNEIEQLLVLTANDGSYIYLRSAGNSLNTQMM